MTMIRSHGQPDELLTSEKRGYYVRHRSPNVIVFLPLVGDRFPMQQHHYPNALQPQHQQRPNKQMNFAPSMKFRFGIWIYVGCLGIGLLLFLLSLILPRGFRKSYCNGERRRYTRRYATATSPKEQVDDSYSVALDPRYEAFNDIMEDASLHEQSLLNPSDSHDDAALLARQSELGGQGHGGHSFTRPTGIFNDDVSISGKAGIVRPMSIASHGSAAMSQKSPSSIASNDFTEMGHFLPSSQKAPSRASAMDWDQILQVNADNYSHDSAEQRRPASPSPSHPRIKNTPDERVWIETLRRLSDRGIRVTAHGIQCEPKRIWLQYDTSDQSLTWQTEFPKEIQSEDKRSSSIVLHRGALHRIPLANVLYVDVGKKTSALIQTTAIVPPSTCFSLLTQQGSLDLQTNSKLERDATVSSLCYLLDKVHGTVNWRKLYQQATGSSIASSSEGGSTLSRQRLAASTQLFPSPSHVDI